MDLVDVIDRLLAIVVKVGQQINFVEQRGITELKHLWIFDRLVLTFGNAQHHNALVFPDVKLSRTDKIADILDNQQVDAIQIEPAGGFIDHVGGQMAIAPELIRFNLHNRRPRHRKTIGIMGGGDISDDDRSCGYQARDARAF